MQFGQALRNYQTQTQALLFLDCALELHIGAHFSNVLSGETAALVGNGKHDAIGRA